MGSPLTITAFMRIAIQSTTFLGCWWPSRIGKTELQGSICPWGTPFAAHIDCSADLCELGIGTWRLRGLFDCRCRWGLSLVVDMEEDAKMQATAVARSVSGKSIAGEWKICQIY